MKKVAKTVFFACCILLLTGVNAGIKTCATPKVKKTQEVKEVILQEQNVKVKVKVKDTHDYQKFHLSFYTSLPNENTNNGKGVDCHGNPLVYGTIANNELPYGTKVHLNGMGNFVVRDVGAEKYFSHEDEIDVFIPRNAGESNQQYYNRVNNMGRIIVQGYIINK